MRTKQVKIADLKLADYNPRQITDHDMASLVNSIREFGIVEPVVVNKNNTVIGGHQRLIACQQLSIDQVPVVYVDLPKKKEKILNLALNRIHGDWDMEKLSVVLEELKLGNGDEIGLTGFEMGEIDEIMDGGNGDGELAEPKVTLADRFIVPPFSVLDARQGYWQDRKRAWLALGIRGELGRGENIVPNSTTRPPEHDGCWQRGYGHKATPGGSLRDAATLGKDGKTVRGDGRGRPIEKTFRRQADQVSNLNKAPKKPDWATGTGTENMAAGTSIFDPVLCELMYKWFCPSGGAILDPFAGGSVRGIVAAHFGYAYTGIELRPEQVAANEKQSAEILKDNKPTWVIGDAVNVEELASDEYDLIFSCPPYFDLEVYSDLDGELSAIKVYADFLKAYQGIITKSVAKLKDNRFACFVVGDIRDKKGFYRNFVSDTIAAFRDAGMQLYNEAILVTAIGSLPIRAGKQFGSYRKLGKTHQNVLVFYKGDVKNIKQGFDSGVPHLDLSCETDESVEIRISGTMLRQKFHPCEEEFIRDVCKGRCCQGSNGIMVTIHPSEKSRIESLGAKVCDGFIVPDARKLCPFKTDDGFCSIHGPEKPLGCQASPFTLNHNDLLIVRNRYRLLRCYDCEGVLPAYKAHKWSLDRIFGEAEATKIATRAEAGEKIFIAKIPASVYRILKDNDVAKKMM